MQNKIYNIPVEVISALKNLHLYCEGSPDSSVAKEMDEHVKTLEQFVYAQSSLLKDLHDDQLKVVE